MHKQLDDYKKLVDKELDIFFKGVDQKYSNYSIYMHKVFSELVDLTLRGGKRLRPSILYYSFIASGGNYDKTEDVVKISTFIELFESFLLIHDDIMDRDSIRRGGKTNHIAHYEFAIQNKLKDAKHYGFVMAMLAGDLANQFGYKIIANSSFDNEKKIQVMDFVSRKVSEVILGQISDFVLPQLDVFEYRDIIDIYHYKTATYTFEIPCIVGLILSGNYELLGNDLMEYAKNAGIAFQIRDDILGVFGEEDVTGKSNNGDIQEGKKTILIWKAMQQANDEQKTVLNTMLGKEDLTEAQADEFRRVIQDTGALDFAESECRQYVSKAKEHLAKLPNQEGEGWKFLEWIADYMLVRKK